MRRLMMLVTVVLVITAMLVASAAPAAAADFVRVDVTEEFPFGGTPVPTVVCDVVANGSEPIGWRNGQCWVFHPTATSFF